MTYESTVTKTSRLHDGVTFEIVRMSFSRRIELTRRVRELGAKIPFLGGGDNVEEQLDAAVLTQKIEALYLEWGLRAVSGLEIDGVAATPETLLGSGPEDLCREVVEEIKKECGLSEEERKN